MNQHARILEELSDGRWTCTERFMDMHIPDYRKRLSELNAKYPGRFDRRLRKHRHGDGTTMVADWRDTSYDEALLSNISHDIESVIKRNGYRTKGFNNGALAIIRIHNVPIAVDALDLKSNAAGYDIFMRYIESSI